MSSKQWISDYFIKWLGLLSFAQHINIPKYSFTYLPVTVCEFRAEAVSIAALLMKVSLVRCWVLQWVILRWQGLGNKYKNRKWHGPKKEWKNKKKSTFPVSYISALLVFCFCFFKKTHVYFVYYCIPNFPVVLFFYLFLSLQTLYGPYCTLRLVCPLLQPPAYKSKIKEHMRSNIINFFFSNNQVSHIL